MIDHLLTVTVPMLGALEATSERPGRVQNPPLLFQAGTREALDDLALEEEERDQRGQATEHRRRHDLGVLQVGLPSPDPSNPCPTPARSAPPAG